MDGTGFHSVVANRAQMCTADCHEENNLTAECHEANNRTSGCQADCQGIIPLVANHVHLRAVSKGLFLSWQNAVPVLERGLPQKSEIQYQTFYSYINSVCSAVSF
jgi:hypothetical protein